MDQFSYVQDPAYRLVFVCAMLWGVVLLAALGGWGLIVKRLAFPKARADLGLLAAWGMATVIAIGGVLNLGRLISPAAILTLVAVGLIALAAGRKQIAPVHWPSGSRMTKCICYVLLGLIALQYVGYITARYFNCHDDLHAYMVFPQKMLQTGGMGPDPYSERRLLASLGGQSFLDCFYQAVLPLQFAYVIDPGLGLLITTALAMGGSRRRWRVGTLSVLLLLAFFVPDRANISSHYTGVALLLALARTVDWGPRRRGGAISAGAVLGLLLGGVVSLKMSFATSAAVAGMVIYAVRLVRGDVRRTVAEGAVCAAVAVALLAPWMLSLKASSGTYLYPLLGQGYYGARYGNFIAPASTLTAATAAHLTMRSLLSPASLGILFLFGMVMLDRRARKGPSDGGVALAAAALAGAVAVSLALAGYQSARYAWPFQLPALIVLTWSMLRGWPPKTWRVAAAGIIIACVAAADAPIIYSYYHGTFINLYLAARGGRVFDAAQAAPYRAAQAAVPAGAAILERLDRPMNLNFRRNQVFLIDLPGGASPPPGLPYRRGPEAVAEYLLGQGLRYVMYSYADEAAYDRKTLAFRLAPDWTVVERSEAAHTFDFQDNLMLLGQTRKRLYDDGQLFVLDLATPAEAETKNGRPAP